MQVRTEQNKYSSTECKTRQKHTQDSSSDNRTTTEKRELEKRPRILEEKKEYEKNKTKNQKRGEEYVSAELKKNKSRELGESEKENSVRYRRKKRKKIFEKESRGESR